MPLYGLLALAVLMVVHELGHFFVARAFRLRVERFSIGFGPRILSHKPEGSDTTYQVALIPFLAYVQIAGMNPFEESDPEDKGSFANASLPARILSIFGGPLANYVFASLIFFAALMLGGKTVDTTQVMVSPDGAAMAAGLKSGDRIVAIDEQAMSSWEKLRKTVLAHPNQKLSLKVERQKQQLVLEVIPRPLGENGGGLIGVRPQPAPMPVGEALTQSVVQPAMIIGITVKSLYRLITGQESGQLTGPLGIMRETEKAAELGFSYYLWVIGFLSTSVGFFNLLPLPALDGGRLVFLAWEAITRQKPNQKLEAQIHMVGMLVLLTALVFVSFREWGQGKSKPEPANPAKSPAAAGSSTPQVAASAQATPAQTAAPVQPAAPSQTATSSSADAHP